MRPKEPKYKVPDDPTSLEAWREEFLAVVLAYPLQYIEDLGMGKCRMCDQGLCPDGHPMCSVQPCGCLGLAWMQVKGDGDYFRCEDQLFLNDVPIYFCPEHYVHYGARIKWLHATGRSDKPSEN